MSSPVFIEGRAELLEAYYCTEVRDEVAEFGLDPPKGFSNCLPTLPLELSSYKDKAFEVSLCYINRSFVNLCLI